ncbi:MAG: fasciclin domain-containing protein, partial [Terriglobus sp.]
MKKLAAVALVVMCVSAGAAPPKDQGTEVGGVMMLPKKTITENAANSPVLHRLSETLSATDVDA